MRKLIVAVTLQLVLTLAGCINVPDQYLVASRRGAITTVHPAVICDAGSMGSSPDPAAEQIQALDAKGFSLLSWNIMKGNRADWEDDFRRLSNNQDLLIIQEAYLTDAMREILQNRYYNWDLGVAFEYRQIKAGVMTASKIEPSFLCTFRSKEPLIRIPKTILITCYPISGGEQMLMVANVHLINYTLKTSHFRAQSQRLEEILSKHKGPLIVAGDFNTWSDERMAIVDATAGRLNLKAVTFEENNRAVVLGHNVDHIYYRGLDLVEAVSMEVVTSDHNPLIVRFRLDKVSERPVYQ